MCASGRRNKRPQVARALQSPAHCSRPRDSAADARQSSCRRKKAGFNLLADFVAAKSDRLEILPLTAFGNAVQAVSPQNKTIPEPQNAGVKTNKPNQTEKQP